MTMPDDLTDLSLLDLARAGHDEAFEQLFCRHRPEAMRWAYARGAGSDAEDITAEVFTQILDQVRRGRGPQTEFRAYVMTAVGHEVGRRHRRLARVRPTSDLRELDGLTTLYAGGLDGSEVAVIRAALAALPHRWRIVLWRLEAEGRRPREIGDELGLSANAVSALAYRARAALRQAYLDAHVGWGHPTRPACQKVHREVGRYIGGRLTGAARERVVTHLRECPPCAALADELREVEQLVSRRGQRAAA